MGSLIWLASYPKSGNTWLRAFIHNLLQNPDAPAKPNELDQFTIGHNHRVWYDKAAGKSTRDLTGAEIAQLRPKVHQLMYLSHPDSRFVKSHNFVAEMDGTMTVDMTYTAGIIYVLRNPLDVCPSMTNHFGMSIQEAADALCNPDAGTLADDRHVPEKWGTWSDHVETWTGQQHPQKLILRYEDMKAKPFKEFNKVVKFLGLKPPRARIQKAIKFSDFKTLQKLEEEHGFKESSSKSERFFNSGRSGGWREQLSEEQVRQIIDANREQMERFDYIPEDYK